MKNHARRNQCALGVVLALGAFLAWTLLQGCNARADKDKEDRAANSAAAAAPASISVQNGRVVLTLDAQSRKRLGLSTVALSEASARKQLIVPAVVLSVQDLASLRNGYIAAQAQLQKSRVNLDVATKEYQRLKTLYQDNQNASAKALEAAEGTMQADKADENAAQQQLDLQASLVRQQWGADVAAWVADDTTALERVLSQREFLVQITIPPDNVLPHSPPRISLDVPIGERATASFLSAFPRVDPRIQGPALLYTTRARPGLAPGLTLVAHLATGKPMRGFVIPESAIVWSEGQAWIYRQLSSNQFSRFAATIDIPIESGFVMTKGLSSGDRVVVRGAQALLSEELLLQGQGATGSDTDPD